MKNEFQSFKEYLLDYKKSIKLFIEQSVILNNNFRSLKKDHQDKLIKYHNNKELSLSNLKKNFDNDIAAMQEKGKKLLGEINRYRLIFEEGSTKFGKITPEIAIRINELHNAIIELGEYNEKKATESYLQKQDKLENQYSKAFSQLETKYEVDADELLGKARNLFEKGLIDFNNEFNRFNTTKDEELINEDISTFSATNFFPLTEIGTFTRQIEVNGTKLSKQIKVILPFIDSKSILVIHDASTQKSAENIHDTLLTRTLLSNEVGNVKLTLSDLKGLGSFFREFIPLSYEFVSVANGKSDLEKILSECEERIQDVSIRYTSSSKYSNFISLGEYNYNKIILNQKQDIIPYFVSVILNLSYEADESILRKLNRLISNGVKNGTQFIITWNIEDNDTGLVNELITNKDIVTIDLVTDKSNYLDIEHILETNKIPESKKHELIDSYNYQYKEIASKITKECFINTLSSRDKWFNLDSSELVSIPIGKSKQHRGEQVIDIKTNDFQSHLMLSGGTGSGKTNFLKTFITSASLQYSPEELEFYLIDLKNGIGFDIFRKFQLPHVKMFAMGAENELILNLLDSLNDEMNKRLNLFAEKSFDDISKYNRAFPTSKIRRTILVIDEFATIFEEDNPYQDEIVAKLSPLAKKSRAAGINLFFSTQNFNHVSHSFSKLKSEIPIRIVLKSSIDAASALLDSRNDALKSVNTVGDGVLNYRLGVKLEEKDNEFFKGYLLENEDLEKILTDLKNESETRAYKHNELLVYDNLAVADFGANILIKAQKRYFETYDDNGKKINKPNVYKKIPLWLGEPTTISDSHFKIELERNLNENILITGIDKTVSINSIYNILSSLTYAFAAGEIAIRVYSFLNEDENTELLLDKLSNLSRGFDYKFITEDKLPNEIKDMYMELGERQNANNIHSKKIFCFFVGLEKARDFFKEDSYSLSRQGEILNALLENGNAYNIHTICEMRQPSVLNKILKSNAINLFKHRIVFHLGSSDESSLVLENRMAGSLYKKDEPHTKYRAIYYNADFEKTYYKFKPYLDLVKNDSFYPINFYEEPKANNYTIISKKTNNETSDNTVNSDVEEEVVVHIENEDDTNEINNLKERLSELDEDEVINIDDF